MTTEALPVPVDAPEHEPEYDHIVCAACYPTGQTPAGYVHYCGAPDDDTNSTFCPPHCGHAKCPLCWELYEVHYDMEHE